MAQNTLTGSYYRRHLPGYPDHGAADVDDQGHRGPAKLLWTFRWGDYGKEVMTLLGWRAHKTSKGSPFRLILGFNEPVYSQATS